MKKSTHSLQKKKRLRSNRNSNNDVDNVLNAIMMDATSNNAYSSNIDNAMDGIGSFGLFDIVTKHKSTCTKKKKTTTSTSSASSTSTSSFVTRSRSSQSSTKNTTMTNSRKRNSLLTKRRPSSKKRNLFSNSSSFVTANSLKNDPFFQSILKKNTSIATSANAHSTNRQVMTNNKHHETTTTITAAEKDSRTLLSLKQIDVQVSKKMARAQNMNNNKKNDRYNSTSGTKMTNKETKRSDDDNKQDKEIHPFFLWKQPRTTSTSVIQHANIKTNNQTKDETSSTATRSSGTSTNHKQSELNHRHDPIINIDDEDNNEPDNHQDVNNSHYNLSSTSTHKKTQTHLKVQSASTSSSSTTLQMQKDSTLAEKKVSKKYNIVQTLYDRSIYGNNARRKRHLLINTKKNHNIDGKQTGSNNSSSVSRDGCHLHQKVHRSWNMTNSINIHTNNSIYHQGEITCMEFDKDGILLAVGDSLGYIRIFDFDEVNAASLKNRSKKVRRTNHHGNSNETQRTKEIRNVRPSIAFQAKSHRISCIKWNPTNEDLLIVSFL